MDLSTFQSIKNPTIHDYLDLVKYDSICYIKLPNYIQQDNSFNKTVLEEVDLGFNAFQYMPKKTKELSILAVKRHAMNLRYVPEELIDFELCERTVKEKLWAMAFVPEKFRTLLVCIKCDSRSHSVCYKSRS